MAIINCVIYIADIWIIRKENTHNLMKNSEYYEQEEDIRRRKIRPIFFVITII